MTNMSTRRHGSRPPRFESCDRRPNGAAIASITIPLFGAECSKPLDGAAITKLSRAARVGDIAPFHVMEVQTAARALEAAGRSVVHMEIGEPDFPTPAPVVAAAQAGIASGAVYYTSALGLPELRQAISRHYRDHYGVEVPAERVIVTSGSSAALLLALALLLNRDEQVLLADPGYP